MKSRICLCNGTILKKDLIRFAPVMIVTSLALWAMGMALDMTVEQMIELGHVPEFGTVAVALVSFLGLVSAVCLFTYLTKKKECDAIHALPLRRDTLLFTKIIAAFIQFAVPFGVFFAFFPGDRGWLFQMTVATCSWLFCFGLAVLAMMLSGRRLAGMILYSLIMDLGTSIFLIVENLYLPLLPGVYPGGNMAQFSPLNIMTALDLEDGKLSEILLTMGGFALLGVVFLVLSWVAYRKRKLERAGDFLVVKWMEPVLAWALGITVCLFTTGLAQILDGSIWVGLVIGLTIGYFAAMMFFARSIKVFGKKNLLGWGVLVAFMAASLYVTGLDPLGLVTRVPAPGQIESVTLYNYEYMYLGEIYEEYDLAGCGYTTTDPAEIDQLRSMHQDLIARGDQEVDLEQEVRNRFFLVYKLRDGSEMIRTYHILEGEELKQVKYFLSQPENLLGSADIDELVESITELYAYGVNGGTIHTERAFLEVFLEECEAGWMYTPDYEGESSWNIQFWINKGTDQQNYRNIEVPLTAQKTIAWIEAYFKSQD